MENQMTETVPARDARAYLGQETDARAELREVRAAQELSVLQVPVGTNLADVERWMIFATLQKCGGNKTRAAALLGVSLKTLYNRLNAYRAQGLVMDYAASADRDIEITGLHADLEGELTEVPV
ncbi:MAG TPA: helix-turn-helix domain-containing protein [Steroidobacteraceae bacterium]|nr:helix-turn-helix domain-containing protein [Steroidobacteraceae bacterium]